MGVSSSRNEKKKCLKNEKKSAGMGWATAQLCHNTVGNCIVKQQVLGVKWVVGRVTIQKLYHDLAVVRLDRLESVLQHGIVYCSWVVGRMCHNTPSVL